MHVSSSDESLIFQVQDNATTHFMVDVIHVDVLDDVLVNETTGYGTSNWPRPDDADLFCW